MRVFSLQGILILLVYAAILDRVLGMIPGFTYVSPFTAAASVKAGGGKVDVMVSALQALPTLLVAALFVTFTPKLF